MNSPAAPASSRRTLIGGIVVGLLAFWVIFQGMAPVQPDGYDLVAFGRLPIQSVGRIKPLSSEAINTLRLLAGKSSIWVDAPAGGKQKLPAIQWYAMTLFNPSTTIDMKVFRIDNPEVKDDLELADKEKLFSYKELMPHRQHIADKARAADGKETNERTRYERNMLELSSKLVTYEILASALNYREQLNISNLSTSYVNLVPKGLAATPGGTPSDEEKQNLDLFRSLYQVLGSLGQDTQFQVVPADTDDPEAHWLNPYEAMVMAIDAKQAAIPPYVAGYAELYTTWNNRDAASSERFNVAVQQILTQYKASPAGHSAWRVATESLFNRVQPFYKSIVFYVLIFLMTCVAWLKWSDTLNRYAYWLMALAFVVQTVGMVMRVIITGRPPITNLYTSALFVGWMAVLMGLIVEPIFKRGFATTSAVVVGALSLMKGFQIALEGGDTMGVLVAVLDSNFWLATHVICITIGYSACFFAALIGHIYLLRGIFTRKLDATTARTLELMTYGVLCFGLLFSVVGTILGGIWADQSWGRFWGWDPKENGALLICLWLIIILHARVGGYISQRGTMVAATFASVITAVSWFGVNLLGAGLHSYGFTERGLWSLMLFLGIEVVLSALGGFLPLSAWGSSKHLLRQVINLKPDAT